MWAPSGVPTGGQRRVCFILMFYTCLCEIFYNKEVLEINKERINKSLPGALASFLLAAPPLPAQSQHRAWHSWRKTGCSLPFTWCVEASP